MAKYIKKSILDDVVIPHTAFENAMEILEQGISSIGDGDPVGFLLTGKSRSGKTTLIKHLASLYPTYRDETGVKMPVLLFKVPGDPNQGGLAKTMLKELGDPFWHSSGSVIKLTNRVYELMSSLEVKVVIMDEFQHFADDSSHNIKINKKSINWFKNLMDETGVMFVASGLHYAESIITKDEQLEFRFNSPIEMPVFVWESDVSRNEFIGILSAFYSVIKNHEITFPNILNEELSYRMFCASQGRIGLVYKILRQTLWDVVDKGRSVVEIEDLAKAYDKTMKPISKAEIKNPFRKTSINELVENAISDAEIDYQARLENGYLPKKPRRSKASNKTAPGGLEAF